MLAASLAVVVLHAPSAFAHGVVDQENLFTPGNTTTCSTTLMGQSFYPTKSNLTGFDLMFSGPGNFSYRVMDLSNGQQVVATGGPVTVSTTDWTHIDLGAPIQLTLGHRYAIEQTTGTAASYVCEDFPFLGDYAGGTATFFGFELFFTDLVFRTYYDPDAPVPVPCGSGDASIPNTCTYTSIGVEDTFTVPDGVDSIHVVAIGGQGGRGSFGNSSGGSGAKVTADVDMTPGTRLYVAVAGNGGDQLLSGVPGAGGFNGGGPGTFSPPGYAGSGGGGGASDIRSASRDTVDSLDTRLVVAAGGGGGGGEDANLSTPGGSGGNAGSDGSAGTYAGGGLAGTLEAGGNGGAGGAGITFGNPGGDGLQGQGGSGGFPNGNGGAGGGGGGGYFGGGGGGGGGFGDGGYGTGGGGGGGSSFPASATIEPDSIGVPRITITWVSDDDAPDVDVSFTPGPSGWFTIAPATGTVAADDSSSGGSNITDIDCIGATVGTITGLGTPEASAPITVSAQGTTEVSCTAADSAGNDGAGTGSDNDATVKLDSVAPSVAVSGGHAPKDGFLVAQDFSSFPATAGAPSIDLTGTYSDATSGVVSVVVDGKSATLGSWSVSEIPLDPGENTVAATATDAAGNTATASVTVSFNRDLDGDGIRNNVDTDPHTTSVAWSDAELGGSTTGTIAAMGGASAVVIEDVASPQGVKVTTTAGQPNPKLKLNYKGGNVFVSVPGSTIITDPDLTTTIEVLDGSAELELTVDGSPLVIVIAEGASATVTWSEMDGVVSNVVIADVTGDPGDVTVNGVAVGPDGTIALGTLSGRLSVTKGSFSFSGTFELGTAGDGVADPLTEDVTLKLGSYVFVVPGGSFATASDGAYAFAGTISGVKQSIELKPAKGGGWSVKANGKRVTGLTNPVSVGFGVGDDAGFTTVTASLK